MSPLYCISTTDSLELEGTHKMLTVAEIMTSGPRLSGLEHSDWYVGMVEVNIPLKTPLKIRAKIIMPYVTDAACKIVPTIIPMPALNVSSEIPGLETSKVTYTYRVLIRPNLSPTYKLSNAPSIQPSWSK